MNKIGFKLRANGKSNFIGEGAGDYIIKHREYTGSEGGWD